MLPDRFGALIIRNKRLLLVTGYDETSWWTPGGKADKGETPQECLERELFEELGLRMTSMKHYSTGKFNNDIEGEEQIFHDYIVACEGELAPKKEITKTIWYTKQNFLSGNPHIYERLEQQIIPMLIKDGYL